VDQKVTTSHCELSITVTKPQGEAYADLAQLPVLFIHGNSSCKEVFRRQMQVFGLQRTCIAIDLPGHGQSDDAIEPGISYNMVGYADAMLQVMQKLAVESFYVVGWSLGGHIGIEMMGQSDSVKGLLISGTPPIGSDGSDMADAFLPSDHMGLTGQEVFTNEEAASYARATCGAGAQHEPFLGEAVRRTDGRARRLMMEAAMRGEGVDQKHLIETDPRPIAVANGANEQMVNNQYLLSLKFSNLALGQVHLIADAGHAPFWEAPEAFNVILKRCIGAC
jgi:pimeloyl-ACP methyl ester carboxylesterase